MTLTETITWRPVAEGLPDAELTVLIACDTKFHSEPVWIGFHDGEAWREANGEPAFVTHWAQLPAAPAAARMHEQNGGTVQPYVQAAAPVSEKDRRVSDFIAGAAWHMANPDEPLGALQEAAESWAIEHATGVKGTPAPKPERWIVARETTVQGVTTRAKLGYTVLAEAEPFGSFDEASAWIKKHDLPLGWVAMQADQSPWNRLFSDGVTAGGLTRQLVTAADAIDQGHDALCMLVLRGKECTCGVEGRKP